MNTNDIDMTAQKENLLFTDFIYCNLSFKDLFHMFKTSLATGNILIEIKGKNYCDW